jgi:hypothetical protein
MKHKLNSFFAILALALVAALAASAQTPTTEPGNGPSEQPGAPMEMGQPQAPPPQQAPPPDAGQVPPGQPQAGPEAQPGDMPSGEEPAKTNQGVGRISMTHGDVSTQRGDSGTWSAAILNQPVMNGDKVSTGAGGRAEVQLDYSNILRLGVNSQANIANFTNKYIQVQVAQGIANYSVWGESEAEPEIDTPNVAVHPAHQDGVYRIEVRSDGESVVIVRKGAAQISTPQGIADLKQGEMATVRGAGQDARYQIASAPDRDDWDQWNIERDRMIHTAKAWQHTNKYYVGSEDLDAYGRWENVPDYGQVWVPNESEDWAPYRDGNWTWEPYYGWTWVGYEPWGWAPYHYGRWLWWNGGWGWWPGPVWGAGYYRPFWAPAYVSFFGFGGWGFGLGWGGWGGFGWLPLGPCDWFHPWWGGYGGRFGVVGFDRFGVAGRFGGFAPLHAGTRFSNIAHINDTHISGGMSSVGAGQFGAGHVTATAATHEQISGARMMTGNMPVVPSRASLSASGRAAAPSTIHSNTSSEHFAGTQSASRPESFSQQTAHLQKSMQESHFTPTTAGSRSAGTGSTESRSSTAAGSKSSAGVPAVNRGNGASASSNRGATAFANRPESSSTNRSGWSSFSPSSRTNESAGRENGSQSSSRGDSGSYWNRTAPSSTSSRGYGSSGYGGSGYSRPQLNMRQPIAQPRSSGGYGGGSHSSPSSGGGHSSSGGGGGHSGGGGHH